MTSNPSKKENKATKDEKDAANKEPIRELGKPPEPTPPEPGKAVKAEIKPIPKKEIKVIPRMVLPPQTIKESAARWIAIILVLGFLFLISAPFLLFLGYPICDTTIDIAAKVTDLIKTVASVLSGIVGAVVGYYFRVERAERAAD